MQPRFWHQRPNAPAPGTRLCSLRQIPDGGGREFIFGAGPDKFRMVVFRTALNAWGYVNVCPHFWLPLNVQPQEFLISGSSRVMCSHHSAIFRFEDGFCIDGPVKGGHLDPVPVEVVGNSVIIDGCPSTES